MTDTANEIITIGNRLHNDHVPVPIVLPEYDQRLVATALKDAAKACTLKEMKEYKQELLALSLKFSEGVTTLTLAETFCTLAALQARVKPGAVEGLAWYFAGIVLERIPEAKHAVEVSW